jgi:hypothetical protein
MATSSVLSTPTPPSESVHQFPEKDKIDESVSSQSTQSSPAISFDSNGPSPPPSGLASKSAVKAPIEKMFETFHQSPSGEFKPTFYNPFEVKHRRRTSKSQFRVLERAFMAEPKPSADVRATLAAELNMTTRSIQVWFQNRRAKLKNQVKDGKLPTAPSGTESESSEAEMDPTEEPDLELLAKITGKRSFSATAVMEVGSPKQIAVPGPELMPSGAAIPNQQRSRSHSLPDLQRSPQLPFRQLQEALFGGFGGESGQRSSIPSLQPQITPQMIAAATGFRYPFTTAPTSINPQQTYQVDPSRSRTRPRSSSFALPRHASTGYGNPGGLASISEQHSPHAHYYPETTPFFSAEEAALTAQMNHVDLDYYMILGQSAMNYNPLDYSSSASQSPIDSSYLLDPAEMAFLPQPSNEILLSTLIDDKHFE